MVRAIIIVDHGSRRDPANEMLEALAALVGTMAPDRVYAAHMALAEPTLVQAFERAAADGADFVFVFPYFLSPGRHSREDIPRMCAEAASRHPGIRYHCSGPIGLDHKMAELILHRVDHCDKNAYRCDDCPENASCRAPDAE